ncbi:MAG TPA: ABC transporter ATP-binding protein [Polyangiales bacterium]|nr:ABC transporter ATP-binding protein [Polyangiales bacterium]
MKPSEQGTSDWRLFWQLIAEARPFWTHLALIFALSLLAVPIALLLPLPLKLVVDSILGTQPVPGLLASVLPDALLASPGAMLAVAAGLLVGVSLLQQLEGFASWVLQSYTGELLVLRSRARLFQHAQRLSLAYHDRVGTSDALYRIHDDTVPAHYIAVSGLVPLLTASCVLVALLAVTAVIDWQLALIALAVVPVLAGLTEYYRRRVRSGWAEVRKLDASALSALQEALGALRVVKAFGQEAREHRRYVGRASDAMRSQLKVILGEATFGLLVAVTLAAGTAVVLYVGVRHVQAGALSLGNLLLVMGYLAQLYKPVETISKKVTSVQGSLASADRTASLLAQPTDVTELPAPRRLARAHGEIEFRDVSFRYDGGSDVLQGVSLRIPAGARVGIAGETGAGKTTLISLLMRFFDPTSGAIALDGVDLRHYSLADLRNQYALVLQEPILFSTTIAENIAYGRPGASTEQIIEAARAASAHEFISALPGGYQSLVGERGMTLSGGERQRIALARAFLKDAPVLILDEPTSAVDVKNERAIMQALDRLMRGRTSFIIAHRLNTLESCDLRLEVAGGRIVKVGAGAPAQHASASGLAVGLATAEES